MWTSMRSWSGRWLRPRPGWCRARHRKNKRKPGWFPLLARAATPQALLSFRYTDGSDLSSRSPPREGDIHRRELDGLAKPGLPATRVSLSFLFVIVLAEFDPPWVWAAARGVGVGAVHTHAGAWIDVELTVDHHLVASVDRDVGRKAGVVVDLEHLACGRFHLEALMSAGFRRVVQHCRVEGHLGAIGGIDDVLVQPLVVRCFASTTCDHHEQDREGNSDAPHVASACASVNRPS